MASKIREEFRSGTLLVVHWDGKLVMDLTTKEHVDLSPDHHFRDWRRPTARRPQVGQWQGREHGGSGGLGPGDMGVGDQVVGMSFDTTASNTGRRNGAVSSSNRKWGKTCCISPVVPHILELVVHAVFFVRVLGCSSSPEHLLFQTFQTSWESIVREDFGTGIREEVATVLEDVKDEALRWTLKSFKSVRTFAMGYREFGQLVIIFLGGAPPGGIRFLLLEQCTRPDGVKSPLLLQDLDVPGPVSA
ncbi:hypothetical protein GWK47_034646 [Chionoecetes opilio]|uniref:Uncharacterized protein n=1 Tax=Chionoecetes opilio TaxID=41210 RepID=A0A8J4YUQ1_CHIOP|nr:hypothetical protein GWK47_034646 [Chionoecetes opilio]